MKLAIRAGLLSVPTLVAAHPGHGTTDATGIVHYLTDPLHLSVAVAAVVAAAWMIAAARRRRQES